MKRYLFDEDSYYDYFSDRDGVFVSEFIKVSDIQERIKELDHIIDTEIDTFTRIRLQCMRFGLKSIIGE